MVLWKAQTPELNWLTPEGHRLIVGIGIDASVQADSLRVGGEVALDEIEYRDWMSAAAIDHTGNCLLADHAGKAVGDPLYWQIVPQLVALRHVEGFARLRESAVELGEQALLGLSGSVHVEEAHPLQCEGLRRLHELEGLAQRVLGETVGCGRPGLTVLSKRPELQAVFEAGARNDQVWYPPFEKVPEQGDLGHEILGEIE